MEFFISEGAREKQLRIPEKKSEKSVKSAEFLLTWGCHIASAKSIHLQSMKTPSENSLFLVTSSHMKLKPVPLIEFLSKI